MTQFNLLPDVKLDYIRSQRVKQMVVGAAVITGAVSLFILIIMFLVVNVFQKKYISDMNKDIKNSTYQLNQIPDLDKVLTIQNQLNSLPALHNSRPVVSRLNTYLGQIVPAQIDISSLNVDFDQHTMIITGSTNSLITVNTFVDTLKFTTYTVAGSNNDNNNSAFDPVVLTSFSADATTTNKNKATYTITLSYNPAIFDSQQDVKLIVPPGKITTRSETEKPLFNKPQTTKESGQ